MIPTVKQFALDKLPTSNKVISPPKINVYKAMYNNPTMVCCRKDQKQETSRMFQGTQVRESVQRKLTSTMAKTTKQKKKFMATFYYSLTFYIFYHFYKHQSQISHT